MSAEFPLSHGWHGFKRVRERRKPLIMSIANGFDFSRLNGDERHFLRLRRLVNRTGVPTEKGRGWAAYLLAVEADKISEGYWDQFEDWPE
jgi:hypothetical protein